MTGSFAKITLSDESDWLEARHNALFDRYGHLLLPPKAAGRFFEPKARTTPYVKPDFLANNGAFQALQELDQALSLLPSD